MKYSGEKELIINILKNKNVLIGGVCGSGKSLIIKYLSRLYNDKILIDCYSGYLKIDELNHEKPIFLDGIEIYDNIELKKIIGLKNKLICSSHINSYNKGSFTVSRQIRDSYFFDYVLKIEKLKDNFIYLSEIKNRCINNNLMNYKIDLNGSILNCLRKEKMKKVV